MTPFFEELMMAEVLLLATDGDESSAKITEKYDLSDGQLAKLRRAVEPLVQRYDIEWPEVQPIFEGLTLSELQGALDGPEHFLAELAVAHGPLALKIAIAQLRPRMEPQARRAGMVWEDVHAALCSVSVDELKAAMADPDAVLDWLPAAGGEAAKRIALAKLRARGYSDALIRPID